eukprot:GHVQ01033114.1.p1 GENE.GHVQ01033114.1~~GHVQ01033114.1.p1  ORF type:complete len:696 (-),score=145.24 GHVQ01033114.1:2604-4691(-)
MEEAGMSVRSDMLSPDEGYRGEVKLRREDDRFVGMLGRRLSRALVGSMFVACIILFPVHGGDAAAAVAVKQGNFRPEEKRAEGVQSRKLEIVERLVSGIGGGLLGLTTGAAGMWVANRSTVDSLDTCQEELNLMVSKIKVLQEKAAEKDAVENVLRERLQHFDELKLSTTAQLAAYVAELKSTVIAKSALEEEVKSLKMIVEELQETKAELENVQKAKVEELEESKAELQKVQKANINLKKELLECDAKVADAELSLTESIAQREALQRTAKNRDAEIAELQKTNSMLKSQLQANETEALELKFSLMTLKENEASALEILEQQAMEVTSLTGSLSDAKDEVNALTLAALDRDMEVQKLTASVKESEARVHVLEKTVKDQAKNATKQQSSLKKSKVAEESSLGVLQEQAIDITRLTASLAESQTREEMMKKAMTEQNLALESLEVDLERQARFANNLKVQLTEASAIKSQGRKTVQQLQDLLNKVTKKLSAREVETEEAQAEIAKLRAALHTAKTQNIEEQKKLQALVKEMKNDERWGIAEAWGREVAALKQAAADRKKDTDMTAAANELVTASRSSTEMASTLKELQDEMHRLELSSPTDFKNKSAIVKNLLNKVTLITTQAAANEEEAQAKQLKALVAERDATEAITQKIEDLELAISIMTTDVPLEAASACQEQLTEDIKNIKARTADQLKGT